MQRIVPGISILLFSFWMVGAEAIGQDKPAAPADQYKSLLKEYDRASSSGVPLSDAERLKFIGLVYKRRHALALKFLKLAEKYPADPIAQDALTRAAWQLIKAAEANARQSPK